VHSCWYQYICRHLPGRRDRDGASDRLVNLYRLLTVNTRAFTVTVASKRTASSRRGDDGSTHRFLHEHVDLASSALPPISSMGTAFRHGVCNPCHRRSCRCPGRFNGLAGRMTVPMTLAGPIARLDDRHVHAESSQSPHAAPAVDKIERCTAHQRDADRCLLTPTARWKCRFFFIASQFPPRHALKPQEGLQA
jgi:hypothetical protein